MKKVMGNDQTAAILLLLVFLFYIHLLRTAYSILRPYTPTFEGQVFVQISGKVIHPGVYVFCRRPDMKTLVNRSGKCDLDTGKYPLWSSGLNSGSRINVQTTKNGIFFSKSEMSAYYKITLDLPIDLNKENISGLTAVPGIGPSTAAAIVRERDKKKGFVNLEELMDIKGIGPSLYKKIRHYFVLKQVKG
jgi:competence protein ComEA